MTVQANFPVPTLTTLCLAYLVDNPQVLEKNEPKLPLTVVELIINCIISKKRNNLDLFRFWPAAQQMMTLNLSNHPHVTNEFLSKLHLAFPNLVYLDLANCSVSETAAFKNFTRLKILNVKGTQIGETEARRLSMSVHHLEVRLQGFSFISWFSPNTVA